MLKNIVKFAGNLLIVSFIILLWRMNGTRAYFTAGIALENNTFSTGYWITTTPMPTDTPVPSLPSLPPLPAGCRYVFQPTGTPPHAAESFPATQSLKGLLPLPTLPALQTLTPLQGLPSIECDNVLPSLPPFSAYPPLPPLSPLPTLLLEEITITPTITPTITIQPTETQNTTSGVE